MTSTASHQAGNSRRDQLTSALVVGGVLVVLGAASGLGIEVTSSALPLIKAPAAGARALPTPQVRTAGPVPVNYIGTPGPGNLPNPFPGIAIPSGPPRVLPSASATPVTRRRVAAMPTVPTVPTVPMTSSSPSTEAVSSWPTLNCPSDVVTGLLEALLGNKGLLSSSGLLQTVLRLLPNLANVLNGPGFSSILTTDVGSLSVAQTDSMAQACTPVLSGLLGGGKLMSATLAGAAVFTSHVKTSYVGARAVEFIAMALFYGGLAFVAGLWPAGAGVRRVRMFLSWVWVVGFFSTLTALVWQGAWAQGQTVGSSIQNPVLRATLGSDFGRQWTAGTLLWLLALIPLVALDRSGEQVVRALPWRLSTLALGLGALRVTDLASHAKATASPVLSQLADLVHLCAMTLWIGGLVMLLVGVLPRRDAGELSHVVPRYSTLAMMSVAAVALSGSVLAWELLGPIGNLTSTTYGHLLLLKVALLAVIGVAAFGSKTWVGHRLDYAVVLRRESTMVRPFIVSVAAETALVVAVLAVASFVVTADPGR